MSTFDTHKWFKNQYLDENKDFELKTKDKLDLLLEWVTTTEDYLTIEDISNQIHELKQLLYLY
jgi:hypothetical protein